MENRNINKAACHKCNVKFDPENVKTSSQGHEYYIFCPRCATRLHVFESVEYQVSEADDE